MIATYTPVRVRRTLCIHSFRWMWYMWTAGNWIWQWCKCGALLLRPTNFASHFSSRGSVCMCVWCVCLEQFVGRSEPIRARSFFNKNRNATRVQNVYAIIKSTGLRPSRETARHALYYGIAINYIQTLTIRNVLHSLLFGYLHKTNQLLELKKSAHTHTHTPVQTFELNFTISENGKQLQFGRRLNARAHCTLPQCNKSVSNLNWTNWNGNRWNEIDESPDIPLQPPHQFVKWLRKSASRVAAAAYANTITDQNLCAITSWLLSVTGAGYHHATPIERRQCLDVNLILFLICQNAGENCICQCCHRCELIGRLSRPGNMQQWHRMKTIENDS